MSESPLGEPSTRTKIVAGIVLVVVSLYLLIALGNIPLLFRLLLATVFLWLLYRFVRAHERIAATQERRTQAVERRAEIAGQRDGDGDTAND